MGPGSAENCKQEELLPRKTTVVTNSSIGAFSCKMTSPLAIMAQIGLAEDNQQKLERQNDLNLKHMHLTNLKRQKPVTTVIHIHYSYCFTRFNLNKQWFLCFIPLQKNALQVLDSVTGVFICFFSADAVSNSNR